MRLNLNAENLSYRFGATHENAPAARMSDEQALRRSVLSCLLWESEFYEDGREIGARILDLAGRVPADCLASLAIEARHDANLRHVPLLLLTALIKRGGGDVAETIVKVVSRADELAELVAIYWRDGKRPLSAQMKKGLARAFLKFNEYALAKYNRETAVRLRDVLFLCHAKPESPEREALWKRLANNSLATPDTWEVGLSAGADRRAAFERLIREGRLGYLALLRNLRNMLRAGCDLDLINNAIVARKGAERILPFRYVAAARAAPQLEPAIDQALCESIATAAPLKGKTAVMVDVSGSMDNPLNARSHLSRKDAAAALASVIHAETLRVFSFADRVIELPPRRGMAGVSAICESQSGGTRLFDAVAAINKIVAYDRLIVITDEQAFPSRGTLPAPTARGYMINVASAKNGVGYGSWVHIDGFSESVIRFIQECDRKCSLKN